MYVYVLAGRPQVSFTAQKPTKAQRTLGIRYGKACPSHDDDDDDGSTMIDDLCCDAAIALNNCDVRNNCMLLV